MQVMMETLVYLLVFNDQHWHLSLLCLPSPNHLVATSRYLVDIRDAKLIRGR